MTEENLCSLKKLYEQYNNPVKPLLAEIEAEYEKFPLALYNEIRALNDHVARAFTATDDEKATKQIEKAYNHINRITRDCYKYLNLYYKQESERFDKNLSSIDPQSTEDCTRVAEYDKLSNKASKLVEYAKLREHIASDEETYENFQNAYNAYKDLHQFILDNQRDVLLIKRKKKHKKFGSLIFSILTFILGCVLTNNNKEIVNVFMDMFIK